MDSKDNFLLYAYHEWQTPAVDDATPPFILKPARLPETQSFTIKNGKMSGTQTSEDLVPSYPSGVKVSFSYTFK